ncbi:MAG: hypothetical protein GF311_26595 [Candidatus Lokiarchaeota archaeon]|nr:hypothetical protein [Candidatus Lokiarchaeota archaeon]
MQEVRVYIQKGGVTLRIKDLIEYVELYSWPELKDIAKEFDIPERTLLIILRKFVLYPKTRIHLKEDGQKRILYIPEEVEFMVNNLGLSQREVDDILSYFSICKSEDNEKSERKEFSQEKSRMRDFT